MYWGIMDTFCILESNIGMCCIEHLYTYITESVNPWRLRAHHYYTSSTLIGGKGGAGPSLLHYYDRGVRTG